MVPWYYGIVKVFQEAAISSLSSDLVNSLSSVVSVACFPESKLNPCFLALLFKMQSKEHQLKSFRFVCICIEKGKVPYENLRFEGMSSLSGNS